LQVAKIKVKKRGGKTKNIFFIKDVLKGKKKKESSN
jgi:hypothetical protein